MVVLIHATHPGVIETAFDVSFDQLPFWFQAVVLSFREGPTMCAVPLFMFFAGLLFFRSSDAEGGGWKPYLQRLRRRATSLLVPYLLWNAIYWAVQFVHCQIGPISDTHDEPTDWHFILMKMSCIYLPFDIPTWFLHNLMVMCLLAPLVWWLIKRAGPLLPIATGLYWFCTWNTGGLREHLFFYHAYAPFFFSLGAWVAIKRVDFVALLAPHKWLPALAVLTSALFAWQCRNEQLFTYLHSLNVLACAAAAIHIATRLDGSRLAQFCASLAPATFFVYAMHHMPAQALFKRVMGAALPDAVNHLPHIVALQLLWTALVTLLCLATYFFLRRYMPRLGALLAGGRM